MYLSLSGGAASLLAGYYSSNSALFAISSAAFLLSIIIFRWGYFLGPMIAKFSKASLREGNFELVPSQDALLKRSSGGYYASMFLSLQLRDSSDFKSAEQRAELMQMFERAISSLRHTIKISLVLCGLDMNDYLDSLTARRSLAEQRKSQLKKNSASLHQLEREISAYSSQIRRIGGGEKPMQVMAFAQTTAFGLTREEVLQRVRSQARESAAILSSSLSCPVQTLLGEELLRCVEWEKISPASKSQIEDELV